MLLQVVLAHSFPLRVMASRCKHRELSNVSEHLGVFRMFFSYKHCFYEHSSEWFLCMHVCMVFFFLESMCLRGELLDQTICSS